MLNHKQKSAIIALFLVVVLVGCSGNQNILRGSGVIEATEVNIAPRIGGQVAEVLVQEGDPVSQGDTLFLIQDQLLSAQQRQAASALSAAQANYDLVAIGRTAPQRQAAIAAAELELANAQYALDQLYENYNLQRAKTLQIKKDTEKELEDLENFDLQQALVERSVAQAQKAVEDAEKHLNIVKSHADQADIDAAWAQVVLAEKALEDAKEDFEEYANKPETNLTRATYQARLSAAQDNYDAAVRFYNGLKSTGDETDIRLAEADLSTARANLAKAQREWEDAQNGPDSEDVAYLEALIAHYEGVLGDLETGPDPDELALAEARLANARAQVDLAREEQPTPEQLAVAQAGIENAQANLEAAQEQIDRLEVQAPVYGVVLSRSIEPGELIQPGGTALVLAELDRLTVTVYIPEDRYGQLALGDEASLSVDSFPGESFPAYIIRIADQAEYTPRNVQTQEDRVTTVYAVELSVENNDGRLKPGMPADVVFTTLK